MRLNGLSSRNPCCRSRWPRSADSVFAECLCMSSFELGPEMAQCRAFSEYSGRCCLPDRDPDWTTIPVFAHSPTSDSLQPCGQPKQQFPEVLQAVREFDTHCQRDYDQSNFGAISAEFRAPRSSPLRSMFGAQAFSLSPPIAVVDHR